MSFQENNTTGDVRDTLTTVKRRITRTELTRTDKDSMLDSVHNMRTQIDMVKIDDIIDNLSSNAIGPYNLVFEPDDSQVKMYNNFSNVYGDGRIINQTFSSVDYDSISIGDNPVVIPYVEVGSYHYEPYANFNGTSDSISVSDTGALRLTTFSMSAWFRNSKLDKEDHVIVNKGGLGSESAGQNMNYGMWIRDTETIRFGFEEGDGSDHFSSGDIKYQDDRWHNAIVTYNQVRLKCFLDGVLIDDDAHTATPETVNTNPLKIGANSRASDSFFRGSIDEVRVWNVGLTDAEAMALYLHGVVPQTGNIVYSNTFGGSGITVPTKKCYYTVLDGTNSWNWKMGHHPPSIKNGNSIGLNIGGTTNQQFIYYEGFGTDFDYTTNNLSFGFWVYPTFIPTSANKTIMVRRIDSSNTLRIELDDADGKLFGQLRIGGVESNRQYDTPLVVNTWNYINATCSFAGPTLSLKVNNNADTSSTKAFAASPPSSNTNLNFGGYGGQTVTRFFEGYLAFPIWYKHSTVLTTAERTALYNYNTKSNITKPFILGFAKLG